MNDRRPPWQVWLVLAMLLVPLVPAVSAAEEPSADTHPRLLFGAADVPTLRDRVASGVPAAAWASLERKVEGYIDPNDPTIGGYADPENAHVESQNAQGRFLADLGLAYVVSGDPRYGRHAVETLLSLAGRRWPAWSNNELGRGDLFKGVALAFDWTYDLMTAEERRRIVDAVVAELPPLGADGTPADGRFQDTLRLRCLDRDSWLEGQAFNWTGVCGGGSGLLLLAIDGEPGVPDLTPWLDVALDRVVPYFHEGFGSGGDGAEGVSYAMYGLHNALPFASAWHRATGRDLVSDNVRNVVEWLAYEQMPGEGTRFPPRNDSATISYLQHEVVPMFFPLRSDGITSWLWEHTAGAHGDDIFTPDPTGSADDPLSGDDTCKHGPREAVSGAFFCQRSPEVFTILYHEGPEVQPAVDPATLLPRSRHFPEFGLAALRTGWEQATGEVALTFEAKRQMPDGHWQLDQGNFLLHGYGGRFAVDSGYGHNYGCDDPALQLVQGCSSDEPMTHAGEARGHNVVLVDDDPLLRDDPIQDSAGIFSSFPSIPQFVDAPGLSLVRSDLRKAYAGLESSGGWAERDVLLTRADGEPVIVAITDRLHRDGGSHFYSWRMHTDEVNAVTATTDRFTVTAPSGATLSGAVADTHGPRRISLSTWDKARYNSFDTPAVHTLIESGHLTNTRQTTLDHLAVMALTPGGVLPVTTEALPATGGSVLTVMWDHGEALVASAAYTADEVVSARLATDGDLAKVTVGAGETLLAAGTTLTVDGTTYVTVTGAPATVVVGGDTVQATGDDANTYRVHAPQPITAATVNGQPVNSCREGDDVVFPCLQATQLTYTGTSIARGETVDVAATLTDDTGEPVRDAIVTFDIAGHTARATTDAAGHVAAQLTIPDHGRWQTVTVDFHGDTTHLPSTTSATIHWGLARADT